MDTIYNLGTVSLLVVISSTLLSLILVRAGIGVAAYVGFVRSHNSILNDKRAIALGGGVAFGTVIIATTSMFWLLGNLPPRIPLTLAIALSVGIADDVLQLRPQYKLVGQFIVTVAFLLQLDLSLWSVPLAIVFMLSAQNSWNLVDVMDGLAGLIAVLCFTGIAFISWLSVPSSNVAILCGLTAAGSVIGFLVWNLPPARVFMGESGSCILGTLFGVLVIESMSTDAVLGMAVAVTGMIPLFEMVFLIVERSHKHIPFYRGSPDHFSIRLRNSGRSVVTILMIVAAVALALILAATMVIARRDDQVYLSLVLVALCSFAAWMFRYLHFLRNESVSDE